MNIFVEENTVRGKLNFGNFSQIFLKILPKSTKLHSLHHYFLFFDVSLITWIGHNLKSLLVLVVRDLIIPVWLADLAAHLPLQTVHLPLKIPSYSSSHSSKHSLHPSHNPPSLFSPPLSLSMYSVKKCNIFFLEKNCNLYLTQTTNQNEWKARIFWKQHCLRNSRKPNV